MVFADSSLDMGMFLRKSHFFINIEKSTKGLHKLCFQKFSLGLN